MFKGIRNSTEHLLLHNEVNISSLDDGQAVQQLYLCISLCFCAFRLLFSALVAASLSASWAENDPHAIQVCTSGPHDGTN